MTGRIYDVPVGRQKPFPPIRSYAAGETAGILWCPCHSGVGIYLESRDKEARFMKKVAL